MQKNNNSTGGLNFLSALALIFIVLKLTHMIDWPWVWVLSPIWIGIGLFVVVLLVFEIWKAWLKKHN